LLLVVLLCAAACVLPCRTLFILLIIVHHQPVTPAEISGSFPLSLSWQLQFFTLLPRLKVVVEEIRVQRSLDQAGEPD